MKVDNINKNTNFGWNTGVHENITKLALKYVPVDFPHVSAIIAGAKGQKAILPSFGILNPTHCYSGQRISKLDNSYNHALDIYQAKLADSLVDWEFGQERLAMFDIGEALHVLQDIAEPLHTRSSFISPLKIPVLKKYRQLADNIDISEIITEKQTNAVCNNFYDLFGDTYFMSKNNPNPIRSINFSRMSELAEEYILNACSSTVAFLKRLSHLHLMSDSLKIKAITSERANSKFLHRLYEKNN